MNREKVFILDASSGDFANEIELLPEKFPSNTTLAMFEALKSAIERDQYIRKQEQDALSFERIVVIIGKLEDRSPRAESIRYLLIELLRVSENFKTNPEIQAVLRRYSILYETIAENHARDFLSSAKAREDVKIIEEEMSILYARFPENPKIRKIALGVFLLTPIVPKK